MNGPYDLTWAEWLIGTGVAAVVTFIGLMIYFWLERRRND